MARDLTGAANTAAQADVVYPVNLVELDFSGGFVRVNSSIYSLTYDGDVYSGVGDLGRINSISEGSAVEARGVELNLSGIPSALISTVLTEHYQGRPCNIYFGLMTEAGALVADPILMFPGRMDTMDIELGTTATITVTAESRLADLNRPRVRRYTHEDQIAFYPDDLGLEFVPQMVEKELIWGRA